MASTAGADVAFEVPPFFRAYKDGRIERLTPDEFVAPSPDPQNGPVSSLDVTIDPEIGLSARLYIPSKHLLETGSTPRKLPLLIYFHGGGFIICTPFHPTYNSYLTKQVLEADVIAVSVDYRRCPEHVLPAAYMDSWAAIQWVASHRAGSGPDAWLNRFADFGRVFLGGDSAGANVAHNMAMWAGDEGLGLSFPIQGMVLVHPYFWDKALEKDERMVDKLWPLVCPGSGDDDPRRNPMAEGAPSLVRLGCRRVLVAVAGMDFLKEAGRLYFEALGKSGWTGDVEIQETDGEGHVFHLMNPESEKSKAFVKSFADYINH